MKWQFELGLITVCFLFSACSIWGQNAGFTVVPEFGSAFPANRFPLDKVDANGGFQIGVNVEKIWGKWGLGLYGGLEQTGVKYNDLLPAGNSGLSITRSGETIQNHFQQIQFGIGPILKMEMSKKFDLDISPKFGFSGISYPEFAEFVDIGDPLNQQYTLYQTRNEEIDRSLRPMLLTSLRLNYKMTSRMGLTLSANLEHVRNVEYSYAYLGGDYSPDMSDEDMIQTISSVPFITETRKCHFNSFGLSLGFSYSFGGVKEPPMDSLPKEDEKQDSCLSSLIRNEGFNKRPGRLSVPQFWSLGYGVPKFFRTPGEGFLDPGYAELSGNQVTGSAVSQALDPTNKFILGRNYVVTVGVRFQQAFNTLNYAKIRVIAYNGSLPANGIHPGPGQDIAIIGRSGRIKDCGDWSFIELPVWKANKNFDKIAINVFTNDGTSSLLWIDNVSVCEVSEGYGCDSVQLDALGKPVMPPGYGNLPQGFACIPEEEEEEYYNGTLQDLYGQLYGYDGTTNWYANATDPCFSIGGTLPDEVLKYNCDDSLKAAGINLTCEEFEKLLGNPDIPESTPSDTKLPPIRGLTLTCPFDTFGEFSNMAFGGKDIIYIHGLQLSHLGARAAFKPGADGNWPDDAWEFYFGYYKGVANKNWKPHIDYFLRGKSNWNRYLIVTYNCSQRLDVAVHSVLSQIREAMESGIGVEAMPFDPRGKNCFGRDYVIVSTSTGSLVGDVALSIANKTKTDPILQLQYGSIGFISDACAGHMAVRGAMSGSNLASILISSQFPSALAQKTVDALTDGEYQTDFSTGPNKNLLLGSVLYDLVPQVSRLKWGSYVDDVPVPVITIASGHPKTMLVPAFFKVHPGFDDGVLSMDCSSGRINPSSIHPSQYLATSPLKVFDMGIPTLRGACYYLDQKFPSGMFAIASTPYLSLTGMVQPVAVTFPTVQYGNHYNFVQSPAEHILPQKASYFDCYYFPTHGPNGPPNDEEVLVVSDPNLYSNGIVSPSVISQMGESLKYLAIYYPVIRIKYRKGFPVPTVYWKPFYIWKRTYHKLNDNCLYDCDYGYQYLFRN